MSEIRNLTCDICDEILGTLELPDGLSEEYWELRLQGQLCGNQECLEIWKSQHGE